MFGHHHQSTSREATGINNRTETFGFVTLIVLLLIVSLVTIITNVVIIYKLRLIPGFSFFDFAEDRVVFHKDAYIDRIQLAKNKISGLSTITGNIEVKAGDEREASWLRLNQDGIQISSQRGFEVRCPKTGQRLFPFDFGSVPLHTIKTLTVPSGVRDVKMIRSPIDEDLDISARERIRIRGNGGVSIEGKHIKLEADSIFMASINSSIIFDGHKGVYLDMKMLNSKKSGNDSLSSSQTTATKTPQFKLCICAKNGRLFRIPVKDQTSSCADARFPQSENPCAD